MLNDDEDVDERGALVLRPETPRRGRFTLLFSDAFCFEVSESDGTVRLDFRRRTLRERAALWRKKWGL
jgi:hypothetical protein